MFTYNIFKNANTEEFRKACSTIEAKMPELKKSAPLEDVDGTVIQIYTTGDKKVKVVNDFEVDAVYIDSEIDLSEIFH